MLYSFLNGSFEGIPPPGCRTDGGKTMPRTVRPWSATVGAVWCALLSFGSAAQEISPLQRYNQAPLDRPDIFHGIEHWLIGRTKSEFDRIDASDGAPARCAFTVRSLGYFADPALESVQVGIERFPETSRPDAIDGTMFVRVRSRSRACWRTSTAAGRPSPGASIRPMLMAI